MTVQSFHRILDRLDTMADRLSGTRRRTLRKVRAEIARYPANVQADLGWPPVIDDSLPAEYIMKIDRMN
ncbi:hypothetical protein P7F60_05375 [Rhizobium sp. YJ-22]|uniref:hypothetical protein n=1 Tax=Rhizobium sp. YJ-22 TaxID=3037556 RepID=UPI002412B537|nr:hypothetical protein [Rhizobium sp. YJ-22]MDG3575807.1 hypothetical protein [Rhizobium sp. YJ-22]